MGLGLKAEDKSACARLHPTPPRIVHNHLQAAEDRRSMIAGLRAAMAIGQSARHA
jgi:hypothetical protein